MSHKTVAIKIKNQDEYEARFFYGFGKGQRVQTAWTLSGAKLYTLNCPRVNEELTEITEALKAKKKHFEIVEVSETKQEGFSHEAAQALSNLGVSSLDGIRHYVDYRNHEIKRYLQELEVHLEGVDYGRYEASQKEALNLDNLSMVLSHEVERVAGI